MGAFTPTLFVVSGPSGAGKGTLVEQVRSLRPDLGLTVSATTREPRPGETDGVSYHFMSADAFQRMVDEGGFVEWAHVHGHCYGTPVSEVEKNLVSGRSLILEIDVQGALQVKEKYPDAVLVFIKPPSLDVLEQRLRGRGTETEECVALRLANAREELKLADRYDAVIVNDDLACAVKELLSTLECYERK